MYLYRISRYYNNITKVLESDVENATGPAMLESGEYQRTYYAIGYPLPDLDVDDNRYCPYYRNCESSKCADCDYYAYLEDVYRADYLGRKGVVV